MDTGSQKLTKLLQLDKGKASFKRNFTFKLFPFFTRASERAKFNNGFTPVIGVLSRHSLGLKSEYKPEDYNINLIYDKVDSVDELNEDEKNKFLKKIFDFNQIDSIKHPYILNYYPLSETQDKRGEIDIALYLSEIFNLKNNAKWHEFVGNKKANNLVEKILLESISPIPEKKENNPFTSILNGIFIDKQDDLEFLLKHKDFALKNLDKFFAFYYFQYILQTALNLDHIKSLKNKTQLYPLYFTLETEKLTSTRLTNSKGYNQIKEVNRFVLVNENLLGYINILINTINQNEKFYSFTDIFNLDLNKQEQLNNELKEFLAIYRDAFQKSKPLNSDLENNILLFKEWLSEDLGNETVSRYPLSINEIGDLFFLKNRGSLGKTLTLKKDILILLTALVVKDKKMLIKDVFVEFEKRGIYSDRYTKNEILNFYEKMNILDKKSDSGEVKYVKPVL
ncbi:DNA phosphorothioation-dependent restriction protein DptG [Mammaliicoccus fleurettii]|uniref:DNA phosphorothioation-dependent restriction protein DptG n=1 Tax=Mammaliicoccus fleurettii TaxID=150056 RepID=UPI001AACD3CD|nr:DNA phosphorothioation-dependent restriction protein DptG [Mammaliicoccus fleurettii]MBO3061353.1 DNA phosphorothioation-dependent restriction protein DptG [Mammaliicoccus fleurettii]